MDARRPRNPRLFLKRRLDTQTLLLDEREAHYLGHVLRLRRGDPVLAFNGEGEERQAILKRLTRRDAELELSQSVAPVPEPTLDLTLLQTLIRSEPMDTVVQKATELGVRRILPLRSEFAVVKLEGERAEQRVRHWERIAESACEQSGRHRPPAIEPPASLEAGLARAQEGALRLVLEPRAPRLLAMLAPARIPHSVNLLCGPEGGFSASELETIGACGFEPVSVGPRILRAETAAVVGCAIVQARWGDLAGPRAD